MISRVNGKMVVQEGGSVHMDSDVRPALQEYLKFVHDFQRLRKEHPDTMQEFDSYMAADPIRNAMKGGRRVKKYQQWLLEFIFADFLAEAALPKEQTKVEMFDV